MDSIIGAVVGGLLAIIAGAVATRAQRRSDTRLRWQERHVELSRESLGALQRLVRATINVAYADLPPRSPDREDDAAQAALRLSFEHSVTDWNAAVYSVLVGASPAAGKCLREIDAETDRLVGEALSKVWVREEFRVQRRKLGKMMAEYVELIRKEAGLEPLGIESIWTWDEDLVDPGEP